MAKEKFLKTFGVLVALLGVVAVEAQAQPAYDPSTNTVEGLREAIDLQDTQRGFESRFRGFQSSDGRTGKVFFDGWKVGAGFGYSFHKEYGVPFLSVNAEFDGGHLWSVNRTVHGRAAKVPVRLFSFELSAQVGKGQYDETAYSAGKSYTTYGAQGLIKVRLWEDHKKYTCRHRINLMAGLGYAYARHDELVFEGRYRRINEDGTYYVNPQGNYEEMSGPLVVPHYASGFCYMAGIGYSLRPIDKMGSRVEVRALMSREPASQWDKTSRVWRVRTEILFHFGGRHIAR